MRGEEGGVERIEVRDNGSKEEVETYANGWDCEG